VYGREDYADKTPGGLFMQNIHAGQASTAVRKAAVRETAGH